MNFAEHYLNMPAEVMLNNDLTDSAIMIWAIIDFCEDENGLIASNKELGDRIHKTEGTVATALRLLQKLGYIFIVKKGKDRILSVDTRYIKKYKDIKMRFEKIKKECNEKSKSYLDEALGITK